MSEELRKLVEKWKAESRRIKEMADRYQGNGSDSLMAQSVRYWNCADELERVWVAERERLVEIAEEIEMFCPCGARPESFNTHSHVSGCLVAELLKLLEGSKG